jgi:hypothetical protein
VIDRERQNVFLFNKKPKGAREGSGCDPETLGGILKREDNKCTLDHFRPEFSGKSGSFSGGIYNKKLDYPF